VERIHLPENPGRADENGTKFMNMYKEINNVKKLGKCSSLVFGLKKQVNGFQKGLRR
jgi:hypothetical protein